MAGNKRAKLWIICVLCVAGGLFLRPEDVPPAAPGARRSYPSEITVKYVADGDSFGAEQGYKVRLLNIDTPEYGEPLSKQAKARLEQLILGKDVSLAYDREKKDSYGRLLCHVYVDDVWVNKLLVAEGLAVVYLRKPNLEKMSDLIAVQNAARGRKAGIWSLPAPSPEAYYVRSRKSFRFHRPGCKFARGIPASNLEKLSSRDEAFDKGLGPCRGCRP
jgi:micrococcal nuclease